MSIAAASIRSWSTRSAWERANHALPTHRKSQYDNRNENDTRPHANVSRRPSAFFFIAGYGRFLLHQRAVYPTPYTGDVGTNDDTEQIAKLAERVRQLEAENAAKNRLLATVSHELRTPLTSIGGFSATMLHSWDDLADDAKRKYLTIICDQSERLSRLVTSLLTISRMESGKLTTHHDEIQVLNIIEETNAEIGEGRLSITCPADVRVRADRDHLKQILVNYVSNALKYGADPIEIQAIQVDQLVHVRVCDNGEGVAESFVPSLFEPFTRNHDTNNGIGLGLNIVQRLAKAQGGSAWYEPHTPHGACFIISLPKIP